MQNDSLFKDLYQEIHKAHYILVVTHKNPDADTLSSALSLSNYFFESKIKHKIFNISNKNELPRRLNFLNKFDKISNELPKFFDLIIFVDCADQFRVGYEFDTNIKSIVIDHHQSNSFFANINIVDDSKGSTAELLYSFYELNNLHLSKYNAECLYVGIYDDTSGFTTPRTDKETFRVLGKLMESKIQVSYISDQLLKRDSLARFRLKPKIMNTLDLYFQGKFAMIHLDSKWLEETGALVSDCDDIVDEVLSLGIVKIVAYLRLIDGEVRVSLRSKENINVSNIANNFNGGGHKHAAGLSIDTNEISTAKEKLFEVILDYI
jgi:phosphoesterase RecJ-like protein